MSIAFMLTPENLSQLKTISLIINFHNDDSSDDVKDSLNLINNAIDVLSGSYNNVAFSTDLVPK